MNEVNVQNTAYTETSNLSSETSAFTETNEITQPSAVINDFAWSDPYPVDIIQGGLAQTDSTQLGPSTEGMGSPSSFPRLPSRLCSRPKGYLRQTRSRPRTCLSSRNTRMHPQEEQGGPHLPAQRSSTAIRFQPCSRCTVDGQPTGAAGRRYRLIRHTSEGMLVTAGCQRSDAFISCFFPSRLIFNMVQWTVKWPVFLATSALSSRVGIRGRCSDACGVIIKLIIELCDH